MSPTSTDSLFLHFTSHLDQLYPEIKLVRSSVISVLECITGSCDICFTKRIYCGSYSKSKYM